MRTTRRRSVVSSRSVGRDVVPMIVGKIRSLVSAWPAADATAAQRRAWRGAVAGLRDELRATGGPDGTDFTTEPTTPRLVWTAITSGHHTATGPNDETASIHPAPATAPRDGFVYSANAAHTRRLTTGTAGTVNEAKRLCQQAVTKDHARKVDAGLRDARGVRSADGAHEIAWRAVPGGRHLGSDSTYGTTALVKPIPTASSLAWTLKGAAGGQLAAGIAPDVHQAKRATERAHDSAYGVRKRLARG